MSRTDGKPGHEKLRINLSTLLRRISTSTLEIISSPISKSFWTPTDRKWKTHFAESHQSSDGRTLAIGSAGPPENGDPPIPPLLAPEILVHNSTPKRLRRPSVQLVKSWTNLPMIPHRVAPSSQNFSHLPQLLQQSDTPSLKLSLPLRGIFCMSCSS
ncbi:hypothetical protein KSP40_PGU010664 [Platanthera guangdongensis]|uniref:Uncharacterized protein n=1 Tax=Platanthera guangdongensis TaxID=2320717 RepID=A0ABR2MQ38_9ASPA